MQFKHIWLGLLAALLVVTGFTGCKDTTIVPDEVNVFYVVTTPYMNRDSVFDGGELILFRSVGETASFLDASRGVTKRTWFLDGGDLLGYENDQMAEGDSLIQVKYDTPGLYTVRLLASLDSTDLFYYETVNDTAKDVDGNILQTVDGNDSITCFSCKLMPFAPAGTMDTTFTIQVFDSMQTDFTMAQNGVTGETFEAGTPVDFTDVSKGTPYNWEWTLRGAEPEESNEQNPSVVWKKSGTYRVTLRASRPHIEGEAKRTANAITKEITITPSTAPLEFLSSSASAAGDYIDLSFNQPLIEEPGTGEFTLEVNGAPVNLFRVFIPNSNDSSVLRLVLDSNMPASSGFKLSSTTNILADGKSLAVPIDENAYFKGEGNLFPEGFGDMEGVTSAGISVVPNTSRGAINGLFTSGTVNSDGAANGTETFWKRPWPLREDLTVNTEVETGEANVLAGMHSCKWTPGDGGQMEQHPARGPSFDVAVGTDYMIVVWMKAEGGTGDVTVQVKKGGGTVHKTAANISIPEGEWTRIAIPYNGLEAALHNLKFINNAAGVIYYIDEVGVYTP